MEHKNQFVGIENASRIPGTDYHTQMQIRKIARLRAKKSKSPLFKILAKLGFGQDTSTDYLEREDKGP